MTTVEYLKGQVHAHLELARSAPDAPARAYHLGFAMGIMDVTRDYRGLGAELDTAAQYRGNAALRWHEGVRTGIAVAQAVTEAVKAVG